MKTLTYNNGESGMKMPEVVSSLPNPLVTQVSSLIKKIKELEKQIATQDARLENLEKQLALKAN